MTDNETVVRNFIAAWSRLGVFEMHNGKIRVWRDYFDLATYTKAIA
jgi:limonene-1,2-epoxide hydrolase